MKNLYEINKWSIILTLFLYLTFWGGIIAQSVLGFIQVIMSMIILSNFQKLERSTKLLFSIYFISTVLILLLLKVFKNGDNALLLMFYFIFISMGLALFHLYITYKICKK